MTIARFKSTIAGPNPTQLDIAVEGNYDTNYKSVNPFSPGEHSSGDAGSEFVFVTFQVLNTLTVNQGDFFVFDNNFNATQAVNLTGTYVTGMGVGALHLGGEINGQGNLNGNYWSFTFQPGSWGIWLQIAGISLGNFNVAAPLLNGSTTPNAGQLGTGGNTGITGLAILATTISPPVAFLANTNTVTGLSRNKSLPPGLYTTIAQFPVGTYIVSNRGNALIMSNNSTGGSGGTVNMNFQTNYFYGSTTVGSPIITKVPSIYGIYPNQMLNSGLAFPGNPTILDIRGSAPNYTVILNANASATTSSFFITNKYYETNLAYPFITTAG